MLTDHVDTESALEIVTSRTAEDPERQDAVARPDVRVENHLSLLIFQPLTELGRAWIDENVEDGAQRWAGGLVVEPRYAENLACGMANDGLEVVYA